MKLLVISQRTGLAFSAAVILATFWLDIALPLGESVWLLYILAAIPAVLWAKPLQIWAMSLICMALIVAALYIPRAEPIDADSLLRIFRNRILAICVLSLATLAMDRQIRISAYMRAALEEELQHKNRIQSVMEGAAVGIIMLDMDGVIRMHNQTAQTMFGYEKGELDGKNVDLLVGASVRARHRELREGYMREPVRRQLGVDRDLKGARKDGSEFSAAVAVSPIQYKKETLFIAAIHDLTEKMIRDAMIVRQNRQLKALREIDIAITGSVDLRFTAQTVLKELQSALVVDAAVMLICSHQELTLEFLAEIGFRSDALQHTRLGLDEGYAGQAMRSRRRMFVPDIREATGGFGRSQKLEEEGFVSYMAVPLITKGRVAGVLELFSRTAANLDTKWDGFLDAIAGQAAIAIENAEIYSNMDRANIELRHAYDQTLAGWAHALDIRDEETEGHSRRVTELTLRLARLAEIPPAQLANVRRGALLHDIGKLGVPDSVLLKPGALTDEEWIVMRKHPVYAFEWLAPIDYLHSAIDIPYCHHEKWDGTGYPRGLKGEVIPLAARLFAVVDVWDALRSDRPYRKAWPKEKVLAHIASLSGSHFDPAAVELFMKLDLGGDFPPPEKNEPNRLQCEADADRQVV